MNGQMHGNIKDRFYKFKVYFLICESLFLIHFFFQIKQRNNIFIK